ncbi:MAG TPA: CPBP family intramembrane glutamic endopeptidase [Solirubrobacteraceae bacterium]|nr:CPBP family intramembrane glutamic endopeptidase [Solirubrobacteraceae bacterium]
MTAPAALFAAIIVAGLGGLVVDIPAVALGVRISSSHVPPGIVNLDTFVQDAGFIVTAVFFAHLGGRRVSAAQFGLRPTRLWRALGLVALTIFLFLVFTAAWVQVAGSPKEELLKQLGAEKNAALLVASALLTCVVAPVSEEFLFRGYIFAALRNWRGTIPAAIITGVLFGGVHATSAPAVDLVPLAFLGFALCLLYQRTRSLYPCIVVHMLNNCYAFAELEEWSAWEIPLLMAGALTVLALAAFLLTRAGVLSSEPVPVGARG